MTDWTERPPDIPEKSEYDKVQYVVTFYRHPPGEPKREWCGSERFKTLREALIFKVDFNNNEKRTKDYKTAVGPYKRTELHNSPGPIPTIMVQVI